MPAIGVIAPLRRMLPDVSAKKPRPQNLNGYGKRRQNASNENGKS